MLMSAMPKALTKGEEKEVRQKIDKAKIALMMERGTTFFSALLSSLKLEVNRDNPTAATNAISLWMNPDFCHPLSPNKTLGLMLHEVMHVTLGHCEFERYKHLNQYVLGIAQDQHINNFITQMGYEIPDGGYCDTKYRNMSTMEIYTRLMENPPPQPPDWKPDVLQPPKGMSKEEHKERIQATLMKAAIQAEMNNDPGSIPHHIKQLVEELRSPELPWNLILSKHMEKYNQDDYSYSRPNKRYMPQFYLPHICGERIKLLTFVLDVSGSFTGDELAEAVAELKYVKSIINPEQIRLLAFNTELTVDTLLDEYEDIPDADIIGGGGTNVQPAIDKIKDEQPLFAIIFTDGYFRTPKMDGVSSDIYWVIKDNTRFSAPQEVGTVIHIN